MTTDLTVGVVGCGYWGSKHVRVFSQLAGVEVALIDHDRARREELAATFPISGSFATLDDALPHVDAVVVATRPTTHHELAATALGAGRHVLVEKPVATTVEDALHLISLAAERNRVCMTGHTFEYNPAVWKLREIVSSPDFGDVLYIDAARLNLGLYQPDVNVLWDLAPHDISIINFLLDREPTQVCAWGSRHADVHEDVGYLQLRYDHSSLTANVHVSWLDPCKVRRITVVGTNQMAVYDDVAADDRIRVYDKGVERSGPERSSQPHMHEQPLSYRNGSIVSPFVEFREPLQIEAEHFIECISTGATPMSDGWSGLGVVRVLVAADESLRSGGAVNVATVPALHDVGPVLPLVDVHAETERLHIEVVATPISIVSQGISDELRPVGFRITVADMEQIVLERSDGASITLSHRTVPMGGELTTLELWSAAYPMSNVVDALIRATLARGFSRHGTPSAFVLTNEDGALVRVVHHGAVTEPTSTIGVRRR